VLIESECIFDFFDMYDDEAIMKDAIITAERRNLEKRLLPSDYEPNRHRPSMTFLRTLDRYHTKSGIIMVTLLVQRFINVFDRTESLDLCEIWKKTRRLF
jgi:hypothetical protein